MSSILSRENLDLIALKLDQAELAEQVTGLELLQHFELIDGFWHACVEMVTPTSEELRGLHRNTNESYAWPNGSMEQVFEIGIRNQVGNLTACFCDWFDHYCQFKQETGTRNFLLPYLRPVEYADLTPNPRNLETSTNRKQTQQRHIEFTLAVIEQLNPRADQTAAEIYPDFANRAIELADEEEWPQDLRVEIMPRTGLLSVNYLAKGNVNRVFKTISAESFRKNLADWRQKN